MVCRCFTTCLPIFRTGIFHPGIFWGSMENGPFCYLGGNRNLRMLIWNSWEDVSFWCLMKNICGSLHSLALHAPYAELQYVTLFYSFFSISHVFVLVWPWVLCFLQDLLPFATWTTEHGMCPSGASGNGMPPFWMSDELQREMEAYILSSMKMAVDEMGL